MEPLSQRDPRWANKKLGTSNVTIGGYGCFITSIAYVIGTTPDVVNERMKAVKGYQDGNLVIWSKIPEAFPGITISHLLQTYNNDVVKANLPALITVNGAPIGSPLHMVVYVGNGLCMDPWVGKLVPTSTYQALKFIVLKGRWKDLPVSPQPMNPDQLPAKLTKHHAEWKTADDILNYEKSVNKKFEEKDNAIRAIGLDPQDLKTSFDKKIAEAKASCQVDMKYKQIVEKLRDVIKATQEEMIN
jgi:hypothetical protein